MRDYQFEKHEIRSINRHSLRVVLMALVLVAATVGCVYTEGWLRLILIVLYYVLTLIGYIAGRQFDNEIEASTGPIKRISPILGCVLSLVTAIAIHRWLFWA